MTSVCIPSHLDVDTCHKCLDEQLCRQCACKWHKLELCVGLARECNHYFLATRDRRFLLLRDESMQDARYWRAQL